MWRPWATMRWTTALPTCCFWRDVRAFPSSAPTCINTQIAALIQQNASTPQDQAVYDQKYNELAGRYQKGHKKLDAVLREIESRAAKARALDAFERELLETESMNVYFSAVRFNAMVERVDVLPEGRMVFRFVCGREITV